MLRAKFQIIAPLILTSGVFLSACTAAPTTAPPSATINTNVPAKTSSGTHALPNLAAITSAYVSYWGKGLKIAPGKVVLNEAPAIETGVQNFLDHPSDAAEGSIYSTQPNNWVFSGGWLPVKSLYEVDPNPVVSIQLYAKAVVHGLPHGEIAQIRKSPQIYVDFAFSKNYEDVSYMIWWEQ